VTSQELADVLNNLTSVVVEEARRNPAFAARLGDALGHAQPDSAAAPDAVPVPARARSKRGRRAPGPWDPYAVYAELGETGLRERLGELELDQLRDIVAEHGMNNDGLVMKWKTASRVIDRIVERVVARASKGDAFRGA
jgi:hypothetical protein